MKNKLKRITLSAWFLSVGLSITSLHTAAAFVHPGILQTQADLDRIKSLASSTSEPWKSAYTNLSANTLSSYTPSPVAVEIGGSTNQGNFAMRNDATQAYNEALMWYTTGNQAYATCAINILNSWSTTLTSFDSTDDITASTVLQNMCAAAEILRYEAGSGWTSTNTTNFESLLSKVFPAVYNGTNLVALDGNQGAMCVQGVMAYAIYENNTGYYNIAVNCYQGNASSIDPCVAVTYYIDSTGCSGESGRDQAHPQGALISYASICEMAKCQGLDLWGYASNRLMLGFEYIASYNLGNTVAWTNKGTCNTHYSALSTIDRGFLRAPFEAAYTEYVVNRGLSAPYTAQAADIMRPTNDSLFFYSGTAVSSTPLVAPGPAPILSQLNNMCLDTGGSTVNDARIQTNVFTGNSGQMWTFNHLGLNVYYVTQQASGKTFDVPAGSTTDGQYIQLHSASATNGAYNQRVKVTQNSDGTLSMHLVLENFGFTVPSGTSAPGTVVVQSFCPETVNPPNYQEWRVGGLVGGITDQDIASVGTAGSASYVSSGSYTVNGSGGDIGGTGDSLNYAYQSMTGDCTITVKLASTTWASSLGKIGLMMRNTVNSNDQHVSIILDHGASNTLRMPYRTSAGVTTSWTGSGPSGITAPEWLKIQRVGSTFTTSYSSDGLTWTTLGSATITMNSTIDVGMAVCSRATGLATAGFTNLSVTAP